jgi:hypothetical protein
MRPAIVFQQFLILYHKLLQMTFAIRRKHEIIYAMHTMNPILMNLPKVEKLIARANIPFFLSNFTTKKNT